MKYSILILLLIAALAGCEKRQRLVVTPQRERQCPVCESWSKLTDFDEYDAEYDCPNHVLRYSRQGENFRSAREKTKSEKGP
jgi:hypothetical protein